MGGVVLSVSRAYWITAPQRVDDAQNRALAQPIARHAAVPRGTQWRENFAIVLAVGRSGLTSNRGAPPLKVYFVF